MGKLSPEERPLVGKLANEVGDQIEYAYREKDQFAEKFLKTNLKKKLLIFPRKI